MQPGVEQKSVHYIRWLCITPTPLDTPTHIHPKASINVYILGFENDDLAGHPILCKRPSIYIYINLVTSHGVYN